MYFIDDVWFYIRTFLFHNIKIHGKHLKNDIYVKKYNNSIKVFNTIKKKPWGPKVIYLRKTDTYQTIKFIYEIKYKNIRKLILEYENILLSLSYCGKAKGVWPIQVEHAYKMGLNRKLN